MPGTISANSPAPAHNGGLKQAVQTTAGRASLTCPPDSWDRLVLWMGWGFVQLDFCFACMANGPFPRAAQVLSSPVTSEFVFLISSH